MNEDEKQAFEKQKAALLKGNQFMALNSYSNRAGLAQRGTMFAAASGGMMPGGFGAAR